MATYNKFNQYEEEVHHGVHNLGSDQLVIALTNTAPVAGDSVLADLTEIAYTNLSTRNLTRTSSGQTSGTYKLVLADLTLTASGGSVAQFRYVVVYNTTPTSPADPLICWYDRGSGNEVTLADGENILLDLDQVNGILDSV